MPKHVNPTPVPKADYLKALDVVNLYNEGAQRTWDEAQAAGLLTPYVGNKVIIPSIFTEAEATIKTWISAKPWRKRFYAHPTLVTLDMGEDFRLHAG